MNDIPTLQEQVQEHSREATSAPAQPKVQENPFLPYHHLRQLAAEREQFRQELEAYTRSMQNKQPGYAMSDITARASSEPSYSGSNSDISDALVQDITQTVLKQMTPLVESQVRALLEHKLRNC